MTLVEAWWGTDHLGDAIGLMFLACAPAIALVVDRLAGEPPFRWHPVVWMGRWLGWAGSKIAPAEGELTHRSTNGAFWLGALAWSAGALVVVLASWWVQLWVLTQPVWLAALALGPVTETTAGLGTAAR